MSDESGRTELLPQRGPMTIGQILEYILQMMRRRFRLLIGIALVPAMTLIVAEALIFGSAYLTGTFKAGAHPNSQRLVWEFGPEIVLATLLMMVAYVLFEAAGTHAALEADAGREVSFGSSYAVAFLHPGRYFWLMILRALLIMIPMVVITGGFVGVVGLMQRASGSGPAPGVMFLTFPLLALLLAGAMVYSVVMMIRLSLAIPASVAEDLTAHDAIRRSLRLTKKATGRIFLVMLVTYAACYAAIMVLEFVAFAGVGLVALLVSGLHLHLAPPWSHVGVGLVVALGAGALCVIMALNYAAYVVTFAVLYRDQIRREVIAAVV